MGDEDDDYEGFKWRPGDACSGVIRRSRQTFPRLRPVSASLTDRKPSRRAPTLNRIGRPSRLCGILSHIKPSLNANLPLKTSERRWTIQNLVAQVAPRPRLSPFFAALVSSDWRAHLNYAKARYIA